MLFKKAKKSKNKLIILLVFIFILISSTACSMQNQESKSAPITPIQSAQEQTQNTPGESPGGEVTNEKARVVTKVAKNIVGVKEVAVLITNNKQCLVALSLDQDVILTQGQLDLIFKAAEPLETRISTDQANFASVKALETTANAAATTTENFQELWNKFLK